MRVYTNLEEAASEIKRDIYKSPIVPVKSVQNIKIDSQVHEALDYSYSVIEIPESAEEVVNLGMKLGFWSFHQYGSMLDWLHREHAARLLWNPGVKTEILHPHLSHLIEKEPDYSYSDRLRGSIFASAEVLMHDPYSRRAFWPIFYPDDSIRAVRKTRIPCSIAYHALIRWIDTQPFLHLTYVERACDFKKFWLTDIWLARQWQLRLVHYLNHIGVSEDFKNLKCGNTTHFISSLHAFIDDEIY